jgi:hypothetical protein
VLTLALLFAVFAASAYASQRGGAGDASTTTTAASASLRGSPRRDAGVGPPRAHGFRPAAAAAPGGGPVSMNASALRAQGGDGGGYTLDHLVLVAGHAVTVKGDLSQVRARVPRPTGRVCPRLTDSRHATH